MDGIKKKIAQLRQELDAEKEHSEEIETGRKEAVARADAVSMDYIIIYGYWPIMCVCVCVCVLGVCVCVCVWVWVYSSGWVGR